MLRALPGKTERAGAGASWLNDSRMRLTIAQKKQTPGRIERYIWIIQSQHVFGVSWTRISIGRGLRRFATSLKRLIRLRSNAS